MILHGSRSGQPYFVTQEYLATLNYVRAGAGGLGWHATIDDGGICEHIGPAFWGWNARHHSRQYLAVEFAQATVDSPILPGQIEAFCWWFVHVARAQWPDLPAEFPYHSELAAGVEDGKTDVEPRGRGVVRERILQRLGEVGQLL